MASCCSAACLIAFFCLEATMGSCQTYLCQPGRMPILRSWSADCLSCSSASLRVLGNFRAHSTTLQHLKSLKTILGICISSRFGTVPVLHPDLVRMHAFASAKGHWKVLPLDWSSPRLKTAQSNLDRGFPPWGSWVSATALPSPRSSPVTKNKTKKGQEDLATRDTPAAPGGAPTGGTYDLRKVN